MNRSTYSLIALALAAFNLVAFIVSMSSRGSWIVTLITLITAVTLAAYVYPRIPSIKDGDPDE